MYNRHKKSAKATGKPDLFQKADSFNEKCLGALHELKKLSKSLTDIHSDHSSVKKNLRKDTLLQLRSEIAEQTKKILNNVSAIEKTIAHDKIDSEIAEAIAELEDEYKIKTNEITEDLARLEESKRHAKEELRKIQSQVNQLKLILANLPKESDLALIAKLLEWSGEEKKNGKRCL
jgi:hypothetical protein